MSVTPAGPLVVGVESGRVRATCTAAAELASRLGTGLVCVTVDPALFFAGLRDDGSAMVEPFDPDLLEAQQRELSDADADEVRAIAAGFGVAVEIAAAVGDPARALSRLADERDASYIVVGARSGRHRIAEFFTGSVAAHLSHQQRRPVLVVPEARAGFDDRLPWTAP